VTVDDVFDLLDHAMEPDAWECEGDWEYRAMHWRPNTTTDNTGWRGPAGAAPPAPAPN
jgi:hypothetical protein